MVEAVEGFEKMALRHVTGPSSPEIDEASHLSGF